MEEKGEKRKRESEGEFEIRSFDVLPGKGRGHIDHPGNQYFHTLVSKMMVKYAASTSKAAKGRVQQEVVQTMKDMGGRFLKHGLLGSITEEMDDAEARSKVGQALRYRMKHGPLQEKSSLKSSKKLAGPTPGMNGSVSKRSVPIPETGLSSLPGRHHLGASSLQSRSSPGGIVPSTAPPPPPPGTLSLSQLEQLLALKSAAASLPPQRPSLSSHNDLLLSLLSQNRPSATSSLLGGNPLDALYRPHTAAATAGLLGRPIRHQSFYPEVSQHLGSQLQASTIAALLDQQQQLRHAELAVAQSGGSLDFSSLAAAAAANKRIRLDAASHNATARVQPAARREEEEDVALLLTSMAAKNP